MAVLESSSLMKGGSDRIVAVLMVLEVKRFYVITKSRV